MINSMESISHSMETRPSEVPGPGRQKHFLSTHRDPAPLQGTFRNNPFLNYLLGVRSCDIAIIFSNTSQDESWLTKPNQGFLDSIKLPVSLRSARRHFIIHPLVCSHFMPRFLEYDVHLRSHNESQGVITWGLFLPDFFVTQLQPVWNWILDMLPRSPCWQTPLPLHSLPGPAWHGRMMNDATFGHQMTAQTPSKWCKLMSKYLWTLQGINRTSRIYNLQGLVIWNITHSELRYIKTLRNLNSKHCITIQNSTSFATIPISTLTRDPQSHRLEAINIL